MARVALDRSVEAIGGIAALAGIKATAFSYRGTSRARGQSARPDAAYATSPISGQLLFEPAKRRIVGEAEATFSGGIHSHTRTVVDGDHGFTQRLDTGAVVELTPFDLGLLRGAARSNPEKLLPHALLWTASRNPASLRWAGTGERDGRAIERFTFAARDGQAVTVVCDAATHLPVAIEAVTAPLAVGDSVAETAFAEYRAVDGVQIPHRIEFRNAGELMADWQFADVAINPTVEDAWFRAPGQPSDYAMPSFRPERVGEGIYAVRLHSGFGNSYNSMFAVFDDHVVVIEAPLVDALSVAMTQIVASVAPGKPIRYIVPTHYHHDHIGGIAGYVRAGVTVITTPGNRDLIEKLSVTPSSLAPGAINTRLSGVTEKRAPVIETVNDSRVLRDAGQELRLYQIGPNPHVDEILVVYAPRQRVLFVSDLFSMPINGRFARPHAALEAFAARLDALGLDVETIVPGHGPMATRADLDRALGK